ncbi:MAG: hypothetical protein V4850_31820 [Myxococcota bacterium]
MRHIQAYAETRHADLVDEPLFRTFASDPPITRTLQILPSLTFWSLAFQDLMALNLRHMRDPTLRAIAETHHHEDSGHEVWFLHDLRLIHGELPDLPELFDGETLGARDIAYALVSEVYRCESDWERLALPIVLEEGAKIFLPALIAHFDRAGLGQRLKSLGRLHTDTEAEHTLHGDDAASLAAMEAPDFARARAREMTDRVRQVFVRFARRLDHVVTNSSPERERVLARRLAEIVGDGA